MLFPNLAGSAPSLQRLQLVMIANTPQFVMALTYLLYNSLLTIMVVEHEWHAFVQKPKVLRVSQPRGDQRETFSLSLPYQYSLPLVAFSGVLQWLVSQSLFFAEVDLWDADGKQSSTEKSISTLGYSSPAMFWLLILGFLSWLPVIVVGYFRTYPAAMPLLGSCSAVIAASCHIPSEPRDGEDVSCGPLSWGVLRRISQGGAEAKWLGFSPGLAEAPTAGDIYG